VDLVSIRRRAISQCQINSRIGSMPESTKY
jgi:hypothetical protein